VSATQRRKGAQGEREVFAIFREALGGDYQRLLGQARDGGADGKVEGFRVEVKRRKSLKTFMAWYRQCQQDTREGETSLVVFREDRSEWMALLSLDDLLKTVLDKRGTP